VEFNWYILGGAVKAMKKTQRFALIIGVLVALLMGCSPTENAIPTLMVLPSVTPNAEPTLTATQASLPSNSIVTPDAEAVAATQQPVATIAAEINPTVSAINPTTVIGEVEPGAEPIAVEPPIVAVPDRVMLTFNVNATPAERDQYIAQLEAAGASVTIIPNLNTIVVDKPVNVQLPENPTLTTPEMDYYAVALHDGVHPETPNDPRLPQQWGYSVTRAVDGWLHLDLSQPAIVVAVVDSGICQHTELQGRIIDGYDFVEGDNLPQDEYGHGCSVAGIIAATTNDGIGIAGIAPNTVIMPLRVLDANGIGRYSDVASAIVYAVDNGAQIINLSLGGSAASTVLESAVQYAVDHNVQVIAAAGNSGVEGALYPAAYAPVIAVGSVDANLQRSSFSNYGAQVDTYAPGRDIVTLSMDGAYRYVTGTSFAAPHVAGIAAIEMAFGRQLVTNGGIATVGGSAPEAVVQVTATPFESTATLAPAFPTLLVDTQAQGALNVTTALGVMRSRYVEINHNAVSTTGAESLGAQSARQDTVVINLFNDVSYTAVFDTVMTHDAIPDGFIWIGRVLEDPNGEVILTMGDGLLEGTIRADGKLYQITYAGNGIHAVNQLDENVFISLHVDPRIPPAPEGAGEENVSAETSVGASSNQTVIDVMIVYSTTVKNNSGGSTIIQNQIVSALANANRVYYNSGVNIHLRLVHTGEVTYSGDSDADLDRLTYSGDGFMDSVQSLRNTYSADLVALISDAGSYCGVGWMMQTGGTPAQASTYGYSVTVRDCLPGGITLVHEFGHNQGLAHDRGVSAGLTPAYSYGYGYIDPQGAFRTIMAYSDYCPTTSPCSTINYFSNPDLSFNGRVLGTATENETLALNNSAARVAAFRSPTNMLVTPTPTAPPAIVNTPTPIPTGTAVPATCNASVGTVAALITAINTANASPGTTDVICLTVSSYSVATGPTVAVGNNAFPIISSPIIIKGNGATIQRTGINNYRFFYLSNTGNLNLQNVTLSNGRSNGQDGGAIYNNGGTLTIVSSRLQNNLTEWWGGAIYSWGNVTIASSVFTGNSARTGGALYADSSVTVTASNFVENLAGEGSAIYYAGNGSSNVTQNCFMTNSNESVRANPSGTNFLNATYNWWNSSQGPALTDDADATVGDIVSAKVNYSPYLVRPPAQCTDVVAPNPLAPTHSTITNQTDITFSWSVVDAAQLYKLQVATDNAFTDIVQEVTPTDTSYLMTLSAGVYYWRVNSNNGAVDSAWSTIFTLTVDNVPPDVATLVSPVNGSSTDNVQPIFTWSAVDGAVKYEIKLENSNPPDLTYTVTAANFTPPAALITSTTYYWLVRAQDAAGNWGDWSLQNSVVLETPIGATAVRNYFNTNPTVRWSPLTWAISYEIQVDNNNNFASPEYTAIINNGTSRSLTFTLANDGLYYWRIRASNSVGAWGTWSNADSFLYDGS
jgi:predicted outer membrane repeat protein